MLSPRLVEDVNCRIGSLENLHHAHVKLPFVNCRIGSLEMQYYILRDRQDVNCRIGSLEIVLM